MDIFAHSLWVGVGLTVAARSRPIGRPTMVATVALAALPDLLHLLPLVGWWWFGAGTFATLRAYVMALPGAEPILPPTVALLSHHLHCIAHSALVWGLVSMAVWALRRSWWIPLWGWFSHIVIDVFTHSADYYPSPVFYPITRRGLDGLAWHEPWFMVLNYAVLAVVLVWLFWRRKRPLVG